MCRGQGIGGITNFETRCGNSNNKIRNLRKTFSNLAWKIPGISKCRILSRKVRAPDTQFTSLGVLRSDQGVMKSTALGVRPSQIKSQAHNLLFVGPWARYLTSMHLNLSLVK